MRLYPKNINEILEVSDLNKFKTELKKISEPTTGEDISSAIFIGKFDKNGFKLRGKFYYWSSFYPEITGKYIEPNKVKLKVELNNFSMIVYLFIFITLNMSAYTAQHFYPYFALALFSILFYVMGYFSYTYEFKKLKPLVEKIKFLAK